MVRDCALTGQQVVALVEEQLDRPNPRGSLWGEAGDALIQSLTGCKADPEDVLRASQSSRYFDARRSSHEISGYWVSLEFTTTDPEKDFHIRFNICLQDLDMPFTKCKKTQIMGVTSILNHPSL
ncbi:MULTISPECIES: hypothetical protein [unclassified Inquilinus]|uniref:hypothetical protein n=1 Tax=unclassified Inquilinus TaxID=2645927 RepID=UPI003F92DF94